MQDLSPTLKNYIETGVTTYIDLRKTNIGLSSSDPFLKLGEDDITDYAEVALDIFLKVLGGVSQSSLYAQLLSNLDKGVKGENDKFIDQDFSPNIKSLVGDNLANRATWKAYNWLRPEKFLSRDKPIQLFEGKIEPTDIIQGHLGDCYFMCTLASLAELPKRIEKIFDFDFPNKEKKDVIDMAQRTGCYCVKIYDMGIPTEVIVDDCFPCISKDQGAAFTKTETNELWVLLLEKAWAKTYFSYDNIEAGLTRECLHDLTGAPTKTLWTYEEYEKVELWENILKGEQKNWVMTAGSNDSENSEDISDQGIVSGHAYSLLAGYEFNDSQYGKVKLVKLRNPWGQVEWSGKWSDKSPEFERIPRECRKEGKTDKDGIFFMEFSDFCKNYSDAQFCLIDDTFKYSYLKSTLSKKHGGYYKVNIHKKGNYFFTVNQRSKRKYPPSFQETFKYSQITIVVGKQEGDNKFTYIEGRQKDDREVWTAKGEDSELDEGVYIVYVKCMWNYKDQESFCLSVYGKHHVDITELLAAECVSFLPKVYMNYAKTVKEDEKKCIDKDTYMRVAQTDDGYAFAAVWNNDKDRRCKAEFRFKNLKENQMRLKNKFHNNTVASFVLEPGEEDIVIVRIKNYERASLSYSQSISMEPASKKK